MKFPYYLLFIFLISVGASAKEETIIWSTTSFPPGYIFDGPDEGQGYADQLDRFMMEKLVQYDHQTIRFPNWERSLGKIKQGPLVCTSILFYRAPDDREPIKGSYITSAPSGVFFLHDVIINRNKRHLFGEEVSFADLLQNQHLRFGYNRPYGITYNRILADYLGIPEGVELDALPPLERLQYLRNAKNISVRSGTDMIGGMLKMLLTDRVDYILEYDFMVKYQQKKLGLKNQLISIPVAEVKNKISRLAYACSDTPQGEKAIQAINRVLKEYRNTKEFKKMFDFIVPQGREQQYWQEHQKILSIYE